MPVTVNRGLTPWRFAWHLPVYCPTKAEPVIQSSSLMMFSLNLTQVAAIALLP
jgi:hypothetical protein